ncbi:MAG: hypothetical protein E7176_01110 [Erysipelotrichaceae bacterium]|nr:hypothetical protein [Erysipelotrichaceae bacterium]
MARVVRKVSGKASAGQKKQRVWYTSKLFWGIVSAIVVIGVTAGILLYFFVFKEEEESTVNEIDYFETCETVDFNVTTYNGVLNYIDINYVDIQTNEPLYCENAFVFAYDKSLFYPNASDNEENYLETYEKLLAQLIDLQKDIDAAKESGLDVELYVVDTSIASNSFIMENGTFGVDGESSYAFMFTYIKDGEFAKDKISVNGKKQQIFSTDENEMIRTTIRHAQNYVKNGLVADE